MEKKDNKITAILLSAGKGKRMGGAVAKQYMELAGRPVLSYALEALVNSSVVTDIVLVTGAGEEAFVRENFVESLGAGADKVRAITAGGKERSDSVYNGIKAIDWDCDYVFIHDGARPFLTEEMLERLAAAVEESGAIIAAVPSKDTIKITDENGIVKSTPDRKFVWNIQTPQCFIYDLILSAYAKAAAAGGVLYDDAQTVELYEGHSVRCVMGDYRNIKITTPEDLPAAEAFLR